MRRRKSPPPPPIQLTPTSSNEPLYAADPLVKEINTILALQKVLLNSMPPEQPLTPDQCGDLCEMLVTLLHFKKVEPEYYVRVSDLAFRLERLCARLTAEVVLINRAPLTDEAKATMKSAVDLSLKEVNDLRAQALVEVKLLAEIPLPGVLRH